MNCAWTTTVRSGSSARWAPWHWMPMGTWRRPPARAAVTNKRWQRIGDSPIIGAGTYANDATCAVSCTGIGESFIRAVAAHDVSCLMEYKGLSLAEAVRVVVHEKLPRVGGEGGLIAVDRNGEVVLDFNTPGMYRGHIGADGVAHTAIFR